MTQPLMKIVIVTEFNQNIFQWRIALEENAKKLGLEVKSVLAPPAARRFYNHFDEDYWKAIREADCVFVYTVNLQVRRENVTHNQHWELPKFVKSIMRPNAKMIAQYDDDFMWLFNSKHVWWKWEAKTFDPEKFFKESGILEIPDAHLTVINNPPFKEYTTKPVVKILLPQLCCRYNLPKYSINHSGKTVAMMLHSIRQSSVSHLLENVIRPQNYPVTIFNGTNDFQIVANFRDTEKLPMNSEVFHRMEYDAFLDMLWLKAFVGLDDNEGYLGWSRFAMECAIVYVPCIGSTEAVQDLFPELYTAPRDYAKQIELIERLRTDKKFYIEMAEAGRKRVLELLDTEKLCQKLIALFDEVRTLRTGILFKPEVEKMGRAAPHP